MLEGVQPPIPTPFRGDEVAYDQLARNLAKWNETDLDGFTVLGSNGEFVLLNNYEKEKVLAVARENIPSNKVMIAGTGCESTKETIRFTNRAAELGANAALIVTPSYYKGKMTSEALKKYYFMIADASRIPVLIYNFPQNTGLNIDAVTVSKISEHKNVKGIKDSSGNIAQLSEIIRQTDRNFEVLVGNFSAFFTGLALGSSGGILAVANVAPRECTAIYRYMKDNKIEEAREIHYRISPVGAAVTTRYGIAGLKAALDLLGYYGGLPRYPLLPLNGDGVAEIREILCSAGLL